eukprot:scaffold26591_cov45-Phaeocystis_antarctica.AAC.2
MVVLAADQIFWTRETEAALQRGGAKGLTEYREKCVAQLDDIVARVREQLSKLQRKTLGAMVTLDVHGERHPYPNPSPNPHPHPDPNPNPNPHTDPHPDPNPNPNPSPHQGATCSSRWRRRASPSPTTSTGWRSCATTTRRSSRRRYRCA